MVNDNKNSSNNRQCHIYAHALMYSSCVPSEKYCIFYRLCHSLQRKISPVYLTGNRLLNTCADKVNTNSVSLNKFPDSCEIDPLQFWWSKLINIIIKLQAKCFQMYRLFAYGTI